MIPQNMIPKNILEFLASARDKQQKIVLVTGVFDLLHEQHLVFLKKAWQEGDILLVAIECDKRVRFIKGDERPINSQDVRKINLKHLQLADQQLVDRRLIDQVMILPDNFHDPVVREEFISLIQPDVLAVSSHSHFQEEKKMLVEKYGGELKVVLEHNPAVSTTKLVENSKTVK